MTHTFTFVVCPACRGAILDRDEHDAVAPWRFCPWCGRDLAQDDPERTT